ncbi:hypothetical protein OG689_20265 [Kitasatospora sp. NBC_00240]|uniref:hypothetical protein n=1 Tax=Kitasatospora sp. NBC_00240 TaxID=2903567 RepID=UPI00224FB0E8|nr:hypothetical protein [Kitasatospora sp. NBC_00240]MCX5211595.1 hypothetical protein [Kitasatospora sp. NBC_00240]
MSVGAFKTERARMTAAVRSEDEASLRGLIERCSELKGELVAFARSARFDRWLTPLLLEGAGPERLLDEGEAIRITDHFILRYRLPDGSTVVDRFVAGRRDLTEAGATAASRFKRSDRQHPSQRPKLTGSAGRETRYRCGNGPL